MSIVQGVVGGLAQLPHPVVPERQLPLPQLASTRLLRPLFSTSIPVAPISPMRIRSRLENPAVIISWRFLKAWYISFHRRRDTLTPFAL
jgi:hypothetical protein